MDVVFFLFVMIIVFGVFRTFDVDSRNILEIGIFALIGIAPLAILYALWKRRRMRRERDEYYRMRRTLREYMEMDPFEFEEFIGWVFEQQGYTTEVTKRSGDNGIDVLLTKDGKEYVVQVKRYKDGNNIPEASIRDFYGVIAAGKKEKGFFVTTSDFTQPARLWAEGKPIKLINGSQLVQAVQSFADREG